MGPKTVLFSGCDPALTCHNPQLPLKVHLDYLLLILLSQNEVIVFLSFLESELVL